LDVVTSALEGMVGTATQGERYLGNDTLIIKVFGAKQTAEIEIISDENKVIVVLDGRVTKEDKIEQRWIIPKQTEPGLYTIKVTNPTDSAETTFEIQ
jgi:hypothetical protein